MSADQENQPQVDAGERGLKVRLLGIVRRIKRAHEIHSEKFRNSGDNADCYDYGAAIAYGDVLVEIFDALTGHAQAHEVPATPCGSQSRAPDSELVRCLRDAAPWIRATCEQLRTCLSSDDGNNRHLREGSRKLRAVLDCLEDQSSVPGGSQSRAPDSRPEGQRAPCPEVVDDGDAPDHPPSGAGYEVGSEWEDVDIAVPLESGRYQVWMKHPSWLQPSQQTALFHPDDHERDKHIGWEVIGSRFVGKFVIKWRNLPPDPEP